MQAGSTDDAAEPEEESQSGNVYPFQDVSQSDDLGIQRRNQIGGRQLETVLRLVATGAMKDSRDGPEFTLQLIQHSGHRIGVRNVTRAVGALQTHPLGTLEGSTHFRVLGGCPPEEHQFRAAGGGDL